MNPILRNILIVIGGFIVGSLLNAGTIKLGSLLVAPPAGVDPSDIESIAANIHLYEVKHFIVPFLAHAIGTLAAAYFICRLVEKNEKIYALSVGIFFFLGGLTMTFLLPAPTWVSAVDLICCYIPMALLGYFLAMQSKKVKV